MRFLSLITLTLLVAALFALLSSTTAPPADAHRDGCHRWHSCPSDSGSYICGDTGYDSECPGAAVGGSGATTEGDASSFSDGTTDDPDESLAEPEPDPFEVGRQRAQERLTRARERLGHAEAALLPLKVATARLEARARSAARFARVRVARASRAERAAAQAEGTARAGARHAARERRAAAKRLADARKRQDSAVETWEADRGAGAVLAVALLLLALALLLFRWMTRRLERLRAQGLARKPYVWTVVGVTFVAMLAFGGLDALAGAEGSDDAGGGGVVMLLGVPLLAWRAWRAADPSRALPERPRLPGARRLPATLAAASALMAVVVAVGAVNDQRPRPTAPDPADVRLAAAAAPSDDGTAVALARRAQALRAIADRAEAREAAAADARWEAAERQAAAARRRSAAARAVRRWERKVLDPDPVYD